MNLERFHPPQPTRETRRAAAACIDSLAADNLKSSCLTTSPLGAVAKIVDHLEQDEMTVNKVWIVRTNSREIADEPRDPTDAGTKSTHLSAWPFWFRSGTNRFERPLVYWLRSEAVAGLRAASLEAANHGIFFNDAETVASRWSKGVQPAVPLWLSTDSNCVPYDPASGQEVLAILRSALHALYVEGESGFFYLAVHDDRDEQAHPLSPTDAQSAFNGMYRTMASPSPNDARQIRLLGAGKAMAHVMDAAKLLQEDWDVMCELWSCPSYTRLARDGYAAEDWNMLNPMSATRKPHVRRCLENNQTPVVAVTGYTQHIAHQIGAFIPARFVALGADSHGMGSRSSRVQWIVVTALKALADEGIIPIRWVEDALKRYALV